MANMVNTSLFWGAIAIYIGSSCRRPLPWGTNEIFTTLRESATALPATIPMRVALTREAGDQAVE